MKLNENTVLYSGLVLSGLYLQWPNIKKCINFFKSKSNNLNKIFNISENEVILMLKDYKKEIIYFYFSLSDYISNDSDYLYQNGFDDIIKIPKFYWLINNIDNKIYSKYGIKDKEEFNKIIKYYYITNIEIKDLIDYVSKKHTESINGIDIRYTIEIPDEFYKLDILKIFKEFKFIILENIADIFIQMENNNKISYDSYKNIIINEEISNNLANLKLKFNLNDYLLDKYIKNNYEFNPEIYFNLMIFKLQDNIDFRDEYNNLRDKIFEIQNYILSCNKNFISIKDKISILKNKN